MVGIIDIGGGNRGVYGAGIFERCLDEKLNFDCCIGVSAGSANIVTFLAGQKGRLYSFYHDYAFRKEYMSFDNVKKCGSVIDLDYIYSVLTNSDGENPLNISEAKKYKGKVEYVVTDAETGDPLYFGNDSIIPDDYWVFKASCCIPVACKPYKRDGRIYMDGGVADPIPIERALKLGCDKIILILTKPIDFVKKARADLVASLYYNKNYPAMAKLLKMRADMYNGAVARAKQLEKEGRCLILAPDDCCGVGTLKKKPESVDMLYRKGYEDGGKIKKFLKEKMTGEIEDGNDDR